jgi:paraquat-inducible protein A
VRARTVRVFIPAFSCPLPSPAGYRTEDADVISSPWIICPYCDTVYRKPALARHQQALCERCGALLGRHRPLSVDQVLALSATGAILLLFVNFTPVMSINLRGRNNAATLWDSVAALAQGPIAAMAVVAGIAIIVAPVLQVLLVLWVFGFARAARTAPGFAPCMRLLEWARPWSMLEVCLLGVLVSVVKLSSVLDVLPGIGLAALALLSVLLIGIAGRDIRWLWELL